MLVFRKSSVTDGFLRRNSKEENDAFLSGKVCADRCVGINAKTTHKLAA